MALKSAFEATMRIIYLVLHCLIIILLAGDMAMAKNKLGDCPKSPNCVSTQTDQESKKMEPIPFTGDARDAIKEIKEVLSKQSAAQLISENSSLLHYTFTSSFFRFVDDVEFLVDPEEKLIHFRSASRTGRSDFGVNRRRMDHLRTLIGQKLTEENHAN